MTVRRVRTLAVVTSVLLLAGVVVAVLLGSRGAAPGPAAAPAAGTATAPTADAGPAAPGGPAVIVPGRPGETAATRPAEDLAGAAAPRPHNAMDTWFVRMMIPHHAQALEMATLAPERAADPDVRALADRIRASQGPEIGMMRGWLQARGLAENVAGHDHGSMKGMQSPEAMRRLADTRGAAFDRLFVEMMTAHHAGAVEMATDLLRVGADLTLSEFANAVATEQAVEIDRMRTLLAS
ncbi:DUF305 domain-containing protein [Micromonospora endolithica]|uniref:DUF305 domain-containing protein n=1 Tax=Micromonospora endolithica TaxID=230091 RepID=A0A3A9YXS4_9ACTN|nr:DUF305 domain-containing protein [Micromonospora endolithica]RKN40670.1 DUF305 domain-containing protein [Micromonospora endolithica]